MACNRLQEILKSCENNSGGMYTAYVGDMDDIDTIVEDEDTWSVTSLVLAGHAPAVALTFKRNTSNYTSEKQTDLINGSSFYKNGVNMKFNRREAEKSKAIKILGEGQRYLFAVVGDANGKFWYIDYLQLMTDTGGSGTARADGSNYDIGLVGETELPLKEISAALAASILVANS